jgi:hypothetical protein
MAREMAEGALAAARTMMSKKISYHDIPYPPSAARASLERNLREKFEALNRVCLTNGEFSTIQKLGLALDENSKRNKQRKKNGHQAYKEQLGTLQAGFKYIQDDSFESTFDGLFSEILSAIVTYQHRKELGLPPLP